MADNIKIVGEILNIQEVSRYDDTDVRLLTSQRIQEDFGQKNDYIEYFVYDAGNNLLNTSYSYKDFKLPNTSFVNTNGFLPIIEIDPVKDLQNLGYSSGEFKVQYNFFNNKVSNPNAELFLKEISSDRTEIRVGSTILTNEQIESSSLALINEYTGSTYFTDYVINFGNNDQVLAVNVALNKIESGYEILFKLYQPLPISIQEKSNLWVVKEKINPFIFDINLDKLIFPAPLPQLRGPNFGIDIPNQNNIATSYQTYDGLINSVQGISTSSYQQLLSLITSQSIDINVDYSDYNNYIFFSSAEQRVKNFYTKAKQIEDYKNDIAKYNASSSLFPNMINDKNAATSSINDIITNFDGYEYYLYFESSSYTWPKSNTTLPYILATTASANSWYNAITGSAADYDNDNQNNLVYTLPSFIKDDENNNQYITFVNMVGHYFDNIWIFLQAVTDINLANNNLEQGVSKDLVYHVLQSLGINLYNQYGDASNVDFLIGNSGSAYYTGSDTQAFTYTGSYLNTIPKKDLLAESYKRIYHNLPLLLKTKGTAYGLETLISTFGIPNKDYYTIGSQSFYTPTGSALTSSILKVKEYGGDVKSGLLDEFNNSKIRIISTSIVSGSGSVLSPFISLQVQTTTASLFRTNDSHYVDISFSPQDKIDIFTSASIAASASATWSLDDFIGDPRYQYSGTYPTLEIERTKYLSPLTASIVPFTGSAGSGSIAATDYNSFIRLIQYFDNSLFKMIKDFIPARANLSTGITISSPILERNKWSIINPSSTSKTAVNEGTISGSTIGTEYTDLYTYLTGSKAAYYDGNITGSYINVNNYFVSGNFNPYLLSTGSIDINKFNHSDFNVTLNNVSKSRVSLIRKDIEYIFGTTGSITSSAELQDSYESLRTHQLSRYDGVKLFSVKYNDYTNDDVSFGQNPVINHNVNKLGLFSEIIANKFLPKRNNAQLKYLVDIEGDLTELNIRNKNWETIQNTFTAGKTGSISLFNNQLYGNQKSTDNEKMIFDSGYSYNPILYFGATGSDAKLSFESTGQTSAYTANAKNDLAPYYISGSGGVDQYPLSGGYVYNIFDNLVNAEASTYFKTGTSNNFPSYSAVETGEYSVDISLPFTYTQPSNTLNQATWTLEVYKRVGLTDTLLSSSPYTFVAGDPATSTLTFSYTDNSPSPGNFLFYLSNAIPSTNITITSTFIYGYSDFNSCGNGDPSIDTNSPSTTPVITAGNLSSGNVPSTNQYFLAATIGSYKFLGNVYVNGIEVSDGQTITIGGTQLTISKDPGCRNNI